MPGPGSSEPILEWEHAQRLAALGLQTVNARRSIRTAAGLSFRDLRPDQRDELRLLTEAAERLVEDEEAEWL